MEDQLVPTRKGRAVLNLVLTTVIAILSIAISWLTAIFRTNGTMDTDGWFLLASGREILAHGIPQENPFSLDPNQGIIIQQWLHDVWLYLWYALGGFKGVLAAAAIALTIAYILYSKLIKNLLGKNTPIWVPWILSAVGYFYIFTYASVRPSLWTCALLSGTLLAVFSWRKGNVKALILLPIMVVLQVNLQASLWPLLLAAAMSFLLPDIGEFEPRDFKRSFKQYVHSRLPLLAACAMMCIASLVNPYGVKGSLYTFLSLGAASYGNLINELRPFVDEPGVSFTLVSSIVTIAAPVLAILLTRKLPTTGLTVLWLAAVVMGLLKTRCFWILWILSFAVTAETIGKFYASRTEASYQEEGQYPLLSRCIPYFMVAVLFISSIINSFSALDSGWLSYDSDATPIAEKLADTNFRIYASDATFMNYLEWKGVKVTYDMRPEIWAPSIAGDSTHDDYKRWADTLISNSFESLNDSYWDYAVIDNAKIKQFEHQVAHYRKLLETGSFALYKLG